MEYRQGRGDAQPIIALAYHVTMNGVGRGKTTEIEKLWIKGQVHLPLVMLAKS